MAAHGAQRLGRMVENLSAILGVELLCAAQGVEFRAPLATSDPLRAVVDRLRREVPPLAEDRALSAEMAVAARLVASGEIAAATGLAMPGLEP